MKNEYGCGQQDDSLSESETRFFELVDKIKSDDFEGFKESILVAKYDVNMQDFDSTSNLLTYSIEKKRKAIISFLLNHPDTDVHFENCDGKNALVFAADAGDFETTKILLSRGINTRIRTESQNHNILRYAIRGRNIDILKILIPLMSPEEMNNRNKVGRTPIMGISIRKVPKMLDELVAYGADIFARDDMERSVLYWQLFGFHSGEKENPVEIATVLHKLMFYIDKKKDIEEYVYSDEIFKTRLAKSSTSSHDHNKKDLFDKVFTSYLTAKRLKTFELSPMDCSSNKNINKIFER